MRQNCPWPTLGQLLIHLVGGHKNGAEDEIRTRDLLLGKEMLYH
jgi:hypothetical protein